MPAGHAQWSSGKMVASGRFYLPPRERRSVSGPGSNPFEFCVVFKGGLIMGTGEVGQRPGGSLNEPADISLCF